MARSMLGLRVSRFRQKRAVKPNSEGIMNVLDSHLGIHERSLSLREHRMEVLSTNMANADTPQFKARDIDFASAMKGAQSQMLSVTQSGHVDSEDTDGMSGSDLLYRVPFNRSFDGNTVEYSVEQAKFGKASADFQASLTFFENRVSSIRKALRGE